MTSENTIQQLNGFVGTDVAIRKFFQFLASEKKIVNEAVLKSFEK